MKLSKMKAITTSLLATALCLAIGTSTYASTSVRQYAEDVLTSGSLPGDNIEEAYCVEPSDAYGLNTYIRYVVTEEQDAEIEPSVGYAAYLAKKLYNQENASNRTIERAIQEVVWSSDQWGTEANKEKLKTLGFKRQGNAHFAWTRPAKVAEQVAVGRWNAEQQVLLNRSFQYGTVYYGLLYDNENIFNVVNNDLKVLVDRTDNTYTVGPYKLTVKDKYKNGFKSSIDGEEYNPLQILYNELYKQGNDGYNEKYSFAKFVGITGMNGTDAKFIGEDGKEIYFPNFMPDKEQSFYIKFKPNNDGAITETGNPVVNVRYFTAFKGTKATYDADSALANALQDAAEEITNINHVQTGTNGTKYEIKYQDLRIKGKTIEQYVKSYVNTNGDSIDWKKSGDDYVTTLDVNLEYILKDNDQVEHELEFPAKITVIGKKKADSNPVYITYTTNSTLNSMVSKIVSQISNATQNVLNTRQTEEIKSKIIQSLIRAMAEKSTDEERKSEFVSKAKSEIEKILNSTSINNETKQIIINSFKSKLLNEARKLINNVTATTEQGSPSDFPTGSSGTSSSATVVVNSTWKYSKIKTVQAKAADDEPYQLVQDEEGHIGSLYAYIQKTIKKTKNVIQNAVKIKKNTIYAVVPEIEPVENEELSVVIEPEDERGKIRLKGTPVNIQIGGKVWVETPSLKVAQCDGRLTEGNGDQALNDVRFAGIQVKLCEIADAKDFVDGGNVVATTTTDKNGQYRFYGKTSDGKALINPLKKYFVSFSYNGQLYESTYYKNDLSGGFSNAQESNKLRSSYNEYFKDIYSDPKSCQRPNISDIGTSAREIQTSAQAYKAYAWDEKIKNSNGDYIENGKDEQGKTKALTYGDIYNYFISLAVFNNEVGEPAEDDYNKEWQRSKSYKDVLESADFRNYLTGKGISESDVNSITDYINTTLIRANTNCDSKTYYAVVDRYVVRDINKTTEEYKTGATTTLGTGNNTKKYINIYSKASDMARNVDFGLHIRPYNDLALQKDVYKARMIVNGKSHEYIYANKAADDTWEIKARASDALYNGKTVYNREVKASEYLLNGEDAYGNADDNKKNLQVYVTYRIMVKNSGTVNATVNEIVDYYDEKQYTFDSAYIGKDYDGTKLNDNVSKYDTEKAPEVSPIYQKELSPVGDLTRLYFTGKDRSAFDVYHDGDKVDSILHPSEIMYLYVTFKVKNDENGKVKLDQNINDGKTEMFTGKRNIAEINAYSTYYVAGTKIPNNLDKDNNIHYIEINNDTTPAGLIDSDSAPGSLTNKDLDEKGNLKTDKDNEVNNRIQDDTDKSPNIKLVIDQDTIDNKDIRRIQGYVFDDTRNKEAGDATIGDGINNDETRINGVTIQLVEMVSKVDDKGIATGEYVGEKVWGSYSYDQNFNETVEYNKYSSGAQTSMVIMSGPGILAVNPDTLTENNGEYSFKSVPPGDFYVRFIYGDTTDTVLSNQENEVTNKLNIKGRNVKSYNGQDYKSTIYQQEIDQSASYNGISGLLDTSKQNFYKVDDLNVDKKDKDIIYSNPSPDKSKMYYYDIANSAQHATSSDAKDVWDYRQSVNNWSKGFDGNNLLNYRAEILASFEKLASDPEKQVEMLNEFMKNTFMVAQTGIIDTEIEKGRSETRRENLEYVISDVNLGLVERPKSVIKINKEVDNFSMVNGTQILFNVTNNQSVENLYFSKHQSHGIEKNNGLITRVNINKERENSQVSPELLQVYVDDEARNGAKIDVRYKISVENVGEVDYKTAEFYYKGTPGDENDIAKTSINKVIDYVSNAIIYDTQKQEQNIWEEHRDTSRILLGEADKNYVNDIYKENLETYNTILTTESLSAPMKPGQKVGDAILVLSTQLSKDSINLVYNNLVEVVSISNELGRRCEYSIPGNQEMADQSLGNNASELAITNVDRVQPSEIDADSAQKILIMPPTGEKNYTVIIIGSIMALALIIAGGVLIKKSI